jgi:TolB-like protein/class 3 adenylate cyclase
VGLGTERVERRLAAILAADVAGYSRLTGIDEEGTLARLTAHRRGLIDPNIAEHRGRIVKTTGDGMRAAFASVVDALRCAAEIQRGMAERNADQPPDRQIEFRMGIHLGDIIYQDGDIFGDGVNVAARLETLAEPGGISLSDDAHRQVRGKVDLAFEDIGEQSLKNIAHPVRVYRVGLGAVPRTETGASKPSLTLPDKPSIAVLPFQNMSGDPEQEYFADGIVEEIITALSRIRWLFVIARNSSFTYKGRAVDVKQVGRELGVRYVLEGSLRKAGNKVRITGQLIDCATGTHLWADRFDGALEDIFDLQDQVTSSVIGAIAPKLEQAEITRSRRKSTDSLDAYDYYLRGLSAVHRWTREASAEALDHFARAVALDPEFASAYGMAARCYSQRKASNWFVDRDREVAEARRLAEKATEFGWDDAVALAAAGIALEYVVGDVGRGSALIGRALMLNPNYAWAWQFKSWAEIWDGRFEDAMASVAQGMRLSPHDPHMFMMQCAMGWAQYLAGNYGEALKCAGIALEAKPDFAIALCILSAASAQAGRQADATAYVGRLRQQMPELRISNLFNLLGPLKSEAQRKYAEGLRKAGLPE